MSQIRVHSKVVHALTAQERLRIEHLAEHYFRKFPDIRPDSASVPLRATNLGDEPTLHIDDSCSITGMQYHSENLYLQDRARLRAGEGDVITSCTRANAAFERYVSETLGLGHPEWKRVQPAGNPLKLAVGCWTDRRTRNYLVGLVKKGRLTRIHPYMGSFHVWALAQLLSKAARRRLAVIAPSPGLTLRVNDKKWFSDLVRRLLGEAFIPTSFQAYNLTTLAWILQKYLLDSSHIVIKIPDSAGGKGNLLLEAADFRGVSIGVVRSRLREALQLIRWTGNNRLLVSSWEDPILCSPSAQLWLPPLESSQPPIIEGLFNQLISSGRGEFLGSAPARFPEPITTEIARSCTLLGKLLQKLGYVGRCSFDMLLIGREFDDCELKFIECNGRWGGTSGPMSLMNRLFGDWTFQPYATSICQLPGLASLSFEDLLDAFDNVIFDASKGSGWLIFMDASGLRHSRLNLLVLGNDVGQARERASYEFPKRLDALISGRTNARREQADEAAEWFVSSQTVTC